MNTKNFNLILFAIIVIATSSILYKAGPLSNHIDDFHAENTFEITHEYFFKTAPENTFIKTFLPKNNKRQRISEIKENDPIISMEKEIEGNNLVGSWRTNKVDTYKTINYSYVFEGKEKNYEIPDYFNKVTDKYDHLLKESELIQSNSTEIIDLAHFLTKGLNTDRGKIKSIFNFVYQIPSAPIINQTDALSVLKQNYASCNGKSRLLTALSRALGYPAQIKGGVILQSNNKRTNHAWTEIVINDQFVDFDPLNNHFGHIPANYLELHEGDEPLLMPSQNMQFDYNYAINEKNRIPFFNLNVDQAKKISPISFSKLLENDVLNTKGLLLLLMLPLGGLMVAFLRNVIGIKTFGVFLPVLIAFSLLEIGFTQGILLFTFLISFVGLISKPFNRLGILHTPKLVISLTIMVSAMLIASYVGILTGISWLTTLTVFPAIILALSAERFSNLIEEYGVQKATSTLFQTLLAVSICYFVISSQLVWSLLILFPETLLIVIALSMLLGKYTGFRATELFRFRKLITI